MLSDGETEEKYGRLERRVQAGGTIGVEQVAVNMGKEDELASFGDALETGDETYDGLELHELG